MLIASFVILILLAIWVFTCGLCGEATNED